MTEQLIFNQKIDLPYTYTIGKVQRAFLRALTEGKLLASTDGTRKFVPARPFAPDGSKLPETVEVAPRGTVVASTRAGHLGGKVFALISIAGCEGAMFHLLSEPLEPGTPVEPVWEQGAEPGILALRAFRRAS
jgi:uncharacterized OB-fold protein